MTLIHDCNFRLLLVSRRSFIVHVDVSRQSITRCSTTLILCMFLQLEQSAHDKTHVDDFYMRGYVHYGDSTLGHDAQLVGAKIPCG